MRNLLPMALVATLVLASSIVAAAQADVSPGPDRIAEELSRPTRYSEALEDRATNACHCGRDGCSCQPEKLRSADLAFVTSVDRPRAVDAKGQPMFATGGKSNRVRDCVVAFDISLSSNVDIIVDWQLVSLVVDGIAKPAVPGFARLASSSLPQRVSTAPAGSVLKEAVFPSTDATSCIGSATSVIGVFVPVRLASTGGEIEERVTFTVTPTPIALTEAEVFKYFPRPFRRRDTSGCTFFSSVESEYEAAVALWTQRRRDLHIE
jgi:hypothetical protein